MQFMSSWTISTGYPKQSPDLSQRPTVPAILYDNTTVYGSWIEIQDMETTSRKYGRIVNNVTLAFPHSGIVGASQDPSNGILQPLDLDMTVWYAQRIIVYEAKAVLRDWEIIASMQQSRRQLSMYSVLA